MPILMVQATRGRLIRPRESADMSNLTNIVIGLVVVGLLLARQLQPRLAKESSSLRLVLVLGVTGLIEMETAIGHHTVPVATVAWLVLSLLAGAGMGAVRAVTVTIWRAEDGSACDRERSSPPRCGWFPWPHTSHWTPLSSTPPRSPWEPPASSCTWR